MGRRTRSTILLGCASAMAPAMVGACSSQPPPPPHELRAERLAALEAMGRKCGYKQTGWTLVGTDELRLRPDPNERFEAFECLYREIRKSRIPFRIGFVGNEAYAPGNAQ
jgi:hypothetical protein